MQIVSSHLSFLNTRKQNHSSTQAVKQAKQTEESGDSFRRSSKPQFSGAFMSLLQGKTVFDRVMELAESGDNLPELKETLSKGRLSDVHKGDSQGVIPLMVAIRHGRKKEALLLVSWGSDPDGVTDNSGHNAYWYLDNDTSIRTRDKDAFRQKLQEVRTMRQEEYNSMENLMKLQVYRDRL